MQIMQCSGAPRHSHGTAPYFGVSIFPSGSGETIAFLSSEYRWSAGSVPGGSDISPFGMRIAKPGIGIVFSMGGLNHGREAVNYEELLCIYEL
jgi:hypothetical protein